MATFDHEDKSIWYFGQITRDEAEQILREEKEVGVFLVRDSTTSVGDFVLCVKEDTKVSHYIINKMQQHDQIKYKIGTQLFPDIPNLLSFYKLHYLDTTSLIRPAAKKIEKVIGKFDFTGNDAEDLSFKKGEILTIIAKDEEQWWTARNKAGLRGSIPVPYVEIYEEGQSGIEASRPGSGGAVLPSCVPHAEAPMKKNQLQRQLPAKARVKQTRIPNAYDQTALKLEIGDIITVLQTNINGQWKGELNGKTGYFPFTHVEFLDENEES